jgi:hypothetical protein
VLLASTLATLTITAAGAATYHRLAVTQSAGGGSEGATEFLQTSASGSAVQGEVNGAAYTGLPYPFGLFGFYNGSGTFGIGALGISKTGYGIAGASQSSNQPSILAYAEGSGSALQAVTTSSTSSAPVISAAPPTAAPADGIDAFTSGNTPYGNYAVSGEDDADEQNSNAGVLGFTIGDSYGVEGSAFADANGPTPPPNAAGVGAFGSNGVGALYASTDTGVGVNVAVDNLSVASPTPPPSVFTSAGINAFSYTGGAGVTSVSSFDPPYVGEMACDLYTNNNTESSGQSCAGLFIQEDGTHGYPLEVYEPNTKETTSDCSSPKYPFFVNSAGDVMECGSTMTEDVYQRNGNPASDAVTYAPKETESTVEDFGTAQLVNGSASVALAADFKQTINADAPYMVFMTPHGDNRGLYLASQNQNGFVIRESQSGRSTMAFDYRIVARPYGRRRERLPHVSTMGLHIPTAPSGRTTSEYQNYVALRTRELASPDGRARLLAQRHPHRYRPTAIPASFAKALQQLKSNPNP